MVKDGFYLMSPQNQFIKSVYNRSTHSWEVEYVAIEKADYFATRAKAEDRAKRLFSHNHMHSFQVNRVKVMK